MRQTFEDPDEKVLGNAFFKIATNDTGAEYDYTDVPPEDLCFGITFLLVGIVLQCFAIVYERFNMDPMKRGLVNQVCLNIWLQRKERKVGMMTTIFNDVF